MVVVWSDPQATAGNAAIKDYLVHPNAVLEGSRLCMGLLYTAVHPHVLHERI